MSLQIITIVSSRDLDRSRFDRWSKMEALIHRVIFKSASSYLKSSNSAELYCSLQSNDRCPSVLQTSFSAWHQCDLWEFYWADQNNCNLYENNENLIRQLEYGWTQSLNETNMIYLKLNLRPCSTLGTLLWIFEFLSLA